MSSAERWIVCNFWSLLRYDEPRSYRAGVATKWRAVQLRATALLFEQICGLNGSGKSTLLKMLSGQEECCAGHIHRSGQLRIGYFTQQHVDQLDLTLNAVQSLQIK